MGGGGAMEACMYTKGKLLFSERRAGGRARQTDRQRERERERESTTKESLSRFERGILP